MKRFIVNIEGIVQGVGFRPFVYKLAQQCALTGWVLNYPGGVRLEIEGPKERLEAFLSRLTEEAPPLSYIEKMDVREAEPEGFAGFRIRESESRTANRTFVSPDVGVCKDCLEEMVDPGNRRYLYPFINCTNCGPRFTITGGIPYDRPNTTMKAFKMCDECEREYNDPSDRRFHAQPIACPRCGPELFLLDGMGNRLARGRETEAVRDLLKKGNIVAIKGLGGYHLACDAKNFRAVGELRKRKVRDGKPFAMMAKDLNTVLKYCRTTPKEKELLESWRRPVVLLQRQETESLPLEYISPDNKLLGMMLPYTPLHYLLFDEDLEALVMTSGNRSGEPIFYKDGEALEGLRGIADFVLAGNREIHIRTDDSVTGVFREKEYILRRSRGYVPFPLDISAAAPGTGEEACILACGAELKSAFGLAKGDKVFLSHHIGDLENLETLHSFESGIEHFKKLFTAQPRLVVHDLHPDYLSTRYAKDLPGIHRLGVQHHHAHIAACMAENGFRRPVIGVAFDGTGYGEDGHIWGGEFLTGDYSGFRRAAHLNYYPMPGGEKCIREPWRMAFGILYGIYGQEIFKSDAGFAGAVEETRLRMVAHQLERRINTVFTSSMGRLFDAVSSMAGLCHEVTYEGEAAIKLENEANMEETGSYPFELRQGDGNSPAVIDTTDTVKAVVADVAGKEEVGIISARFHRTVTRMVLEVCGGIRLESGINTVALSGGVFQNRLLLQWAVEALEDKGFEVLVHSRVPANDGGIALGQAAMGLNRYLRDKL